MNKQNRERERDTGSLRKGLVMQKKKIRRGDKKKTAVGTALEEF